MKSAARTSNTVMAEIAVSTQQTDKDAETVEVSIPEKGPFESHNVPLAVDKVKTTVWVVAVAGAAERFCYYALAAPLQNYMQNPRGGKLLPGAFDLGQQTATNLSNVFLLVQFVTPVPFAIVSDMWYGRYKTLMISLSVYLCGSLVLLVTAFPASLDHNAGLPGLISAMILIGIGVGGVKATLPPFLVDQYARTEPRELRSKSGKLTLSDRTLTVQYICNVFYWFTNIAGFSLIPTTWLEKEHGFWASYLLAFASLWVTVLFLYSWRNHFTKLEPQGNILALAVGAIACGVKNRFRLQTASPAYQMEHFGRTVPWDDTILDRLRRCFLACQVIVFSAPFYLAYIQISNNLISQAGQMRLGSIPNDAMQAANPIACILLGPVIQKVLFPFLSRRKIPFGPVIRISVACFTMGLAMAYASGVQRLIYSRGPCYNRPLLCAESKGGTVGNDVSVWVQTPLYFILAIAEILGFATLSEIAYSKAPKSMKTIVQAVTQLTAGLASAIGIALSPAAKDPNLVFMYAVIAGLAVLVAFPFWWYFRRIDEDVDVEEAEESQ